MTENKDDRPQPPDFGEVIKKIRVDQKLTLKAAAELTGIAEAYLWQLENGKRETPRPETIKKLADGYGVAAQQLLVSAGYLPSSEEFKADVKKMENSHLFRDYQKLSEEGKKEFEVLLKYLKNKDSNK